MLDRYARIAHPEVLGLTGRTHIKQKFRPIQGPKRILIPGKSSRNYGMHEPIYRPLKAQPLLSKRSTNSDQLGYFRWRFVLHQSEKGLGRCLPSLVAFLQRDFAKLTLA